MKRLVFAALVCAACICGCGTSAAPRRESFPSRATPQPQTITECASSGALGPPCSAITPEGASGLRRTFVEGPLPATLVGGEIQVDNFGAEQTAAFENVRKSYYCPEPDPAYGWAIPTRGFGETGRGITRSSRCISYPEAVRNLRYLLDVDYCYQLRSMGVNFSHLQVDAGCDLSYNAGSGSLYDIEGLLQRHEWGAACTYIEQRWSYANGKFLSGLYHRRVEECGWLEHAERPRPTHAQLVAKWKAELATARGELVYLRHRIVILRREMAAKGCYPRFKRHDAGPKCQRWRREGGEDHVKGDALDAKVKTLERDLR